MSDLEPPKSIIHRVKFDLSKLPLGLANISAGNWPGAVSGFVSVIGVEPNSIENEAYVLAAKATARALAVLVRDNFDRLQTDSSNIKPLDGTIEFTLNTSGDQLDSSFFRLPEVYGFSTKAQASRPSLG